MIHLVERIFLENIALLDVAMYHFFRFMSCLAHDGECVYIMLRCARGEAATQAMPSKRFFVESRELCILLDDERDGFVVELAVSERMCLGERTEERSRLEGGGMDPAFYRTDGTDFLVRGVGDCDRCAMSELVALGVRDEDCHAFV